MSTLDPSLLARPRSVATLQAAYYAVSGVWPLVSYRSFEAITGRKREPWLVKTVGVLVAVIAAVLATDREAPTSTTRRLGIGSALALAGVDIWYAGVRRRISPVYLLDAVAELGLVLGWLRARGSRPAAS